MSRWIASTLVLMLTCTAASAAPAPAEPSRDPAACAQAPDGSAAPRAPETQGSNLSDHLSRTEGVICPPTGIDPEMHKEPPATGEMPVIPPPGSPGGDPTVRPK